MVECVSIRILRATIPVASIFLYATAALAQVDVRTARDVAVTPAGEVWTITADGAANGAIQRFTSGGMVTLPGGATRIAIGPRGGAWVVNAGGDLYHWEKGPEGYEIWKLYSPKAKDVGVGANGWVWAIASDGSTRNSSGGSGLWFKFSRPDLLNVSPCKSQRSAVPAAGAGTNSSSLRRDGRWDGRPRPGATSPGRPAP